MKNHGGLQALKNALQEQAPLRARKKLGTLPGSHPPIPVHAGQMVEILGEGRWGYGVRLLKERPECHAVWMNPGALPLFPIALAQEGVGLSRILFLESVPPGESLEILLEVLRSKLFEWVLMDQALLPRGRQDVQIRKVQLVAEECGSGIVLLSERETPSFGVQVRVEVDSAYESSEVRVAKVKGGA